MTKNALLPPEPPRVPPARLAVRRAHLLAEIQRRKQRPRVASPGWREAVASPRKRVAFALSVGVIAAGVGTAIALGTGMFEEKVTPPRPLGPRVRIVSEGDSVLSAWNSNYGICLEIISLGKKTVGCGLPVTGAPRGTAPPGDKGPFHEIADLVTSAGRRALIAGAVAQSVAQVRIELDAGRTLTPRLHAAPLKLNTTLRFFFLRVELPAAHRGRVVRAFLAYDSKGKVLERLSG